MPAEWENTPRNAIQLSVTHQASIGDQRRPRMKSGHRNKTYGAPKQSPKIVNPLLPQKVATVHSYNPKVDPCPSLNAVISTIPDSHMKAHSVQPALKPEKMEKVNFNKTSLQNLAKKNKEICQRFMLLNSVQESVSASVSDNNRGVYQQTRYSYTVNGLPGNPAQASAAAAFFAR